MPQNEDAETTAAAAAAVVPGLIEKATNSTASEVDPRLLRAIKATARSSDLEVRAAVDSLISHLHRRHSHVRYLSLLIVDELFSRSRLFRSLLAPNLDLLLSLTVGFRHSRPLPPPISAATLLRTKSIELLEKWNAEFGLHYRQLRLGFDYLKNTLHFQFPNRLENAARLQQERRERQARSQQILIGKFEDLKGNFSSITAEIQSTIDEIGHCLEIISVEDEIFEDNGEEEEFNSLELRKIRLDSLKEGETVRENSENRAVFDALRELHKLLVSKHLVTVQEWLSVLIRVDVSDNKFRDSALKELINLGNSIRSVKKRCDELGFALDEGPIPREENEEDDLWEEGKIEVSTSSEIAVDNCLDAPSTSKGKGKGKGKGKENEDADSSSNNSKPSSSSTSLKSRLFAEAPVVPWSSSLEDWGLNRDALANHRGLELDSHWGRVDPDAVIPAEKIAELKLHCTMYKEESTEIQPCLAPLRKGGLCQRRDLKVCPFHGPIVPRDAEGNPIEQKETRETLEEAKGKVSTEATDMVVDSVDMESCSGSVKEMTEELAKRAVKNVREREKKEVNSLKRAKLAKVREHNEAVLRESAIASTSYSEAFGQNTEASVQCGNDVKEKKATLASMLKKKVTTKDRLAKRLLNTRARDTSSRQFTEGEDSKYREAFPNQW